MAMLVNLKNKLIKDEVFDFRIRVYAGMSHEQFIESLNKDEKMKLSYTDFDPTELGVYNCSHVDFPGGYKNLAIFYSQKKKIPASYIVHELTHIKSIVFAFRNVKYAYGNDEHEANYQEFLFRKIAEE